MPTQYGYPDYQRVSLSAGYQLYAGNGNIPVNTNLFFGYVGNFPYVSLFANLNASSDFAVIGLTYYSDSSKSLIVGWRNIVRTGTTYSVTQYGNVGPWLNLSYTTKSGNPMSFSALGLYGTTGLANQEMLTSLEVPMFEFNVSLAATNGNETIAPVHVQPGPAKLMLYTTSVKWVAIMSYYDWVSGSYLQVLHMDNNWGVAGGVWDVPMLDAPYQFAVTNNDTVSRSFVGSWLSA